MVNSIKISEVEGVEVGEVIGLGFRRQRGLTKLQARQGAERSIADHFAKYGTAVEGQVPYLTIELSCGKKVIYNTYRDIPDHNMRCPCGNPNHWIVKYTTFLTED